MLEYLLLGVSFLGIWLTIIWLHFLVDDKGEKDKDDVNLPALSVIIPVFNEEKTIIKTLTSLKEADYPKDKLKIIVSNDGSTDDTKKIVDDFICSNPDLNISMISDKNSGKGAAVNKALNQVNSDFFAVMDADSKVKSDALKKVVNRFSDEKIGAVISRVVVDSPKNLLQKMQCFEYIISSVLRRVMHNFGTLAITHGAFSVFKTSLIKKLGGFDPDRTNITEDLEIALRLKEKGYKVIMAPDAVGYTVAPNTARKLWRQRIRWYRGYLFNHWRYRHLFFSAKQGIFGMFQLPVNVLAIALSVAYFSIIMINIMDTFFTFVSRSVTIPNYFVENFLNLPSLKEFLLAKNFQIYMPIMFAFILTIALIVFAHKFFKEKLSKSVIPAVSYFIVMPYFTAGNWLDSLRKELFRTKRKW